MSAPFKKWKNAINNVRKFVNNRVAWIQEYTGNGYVYYGANDSLPNEIIEAINNSGTATACANRLKQFIQADGFKDQYTGKFRINKNQTFDTLLSDLVENDVKLQGFALQLFFNKAGKISAIKSLPIPWIRRKDDNHFVVNRLMGEQGKNVSNEFTIREFDPTEDANERLQRVKEQTRKNKNIQVGELFYCFRPKLGRNYDMYPVPSFYSGIDDIISDGKISSLELRNIIQGWRTPIIISTGPIDNQNEILDTDGSGTGVTQLDLFNQNIEDFLGEDAAPVMHLMARTEEEKPNITTIDMKEIVDMTEKGTLRVGEKVCRLMEVPKILVGFAQAGQLGNVNELKNQMDLFYNTIINRQNFITEKLNIIKDFIQNGDGLDFEISKLNPLTLIPDSVVARLTDKELRELYEIPKVEGEQVANTEVMEEVQAVQVNEHLKTLTGKQQQQLDRINRKYQKGDLTEVQAIIQLTGGFGFTEQEAKKYLGIEIIEDGNNNA